MKKGEDFTGITVTHFCHDGKGRVLMAKRTDQCRDEHGTWDHGGGAVEFHDTVDQTLRKEVMEEYGTDILDYQFLGYRDVHREHDGKKTHWLALDFKVLIDPEKVVNGEPHKHAEVRWFTRETIPTPMHSQFVVFWEMYKDKLL